MPSTKITLDESRIIEFDDALSLAFPSETTQVHIIASSSEKRSKSKSQATFTRTKIPVFTDDNGDTYEELYVPNGMQIRLKFGNDGSKIHVIGPGTVGANGSEGYFTGAGRADLTLPSMDIEWAGFKVRQGPSTSSGVSKFDIRGGPVKQPDLLTVELCDPAAPIDLVFKGHGVNVQSEVDLPQGHLDIQTEAGGSTVKVVAESTNMRSTSGTLKAEGSQFAKWKMHSSSGAQWGPEPTGQGIMYTETGTIFAAAPRVSKSEKKNTLDISTRGTAYVDVPEGYKGSVTADWKQWGRCTVDGSQKSGGHYEETGGPHGSTDDGLSVAATGSGKIFILHKKPSSSKVFNDEDTEQGGEGPPKYSELYPKTD